MRRLLPILLPCLLFMACKSRKAIATEKPKAEMTAEMIRTRMNASRFDFRYVVIRGKADLDSEMGKIGFTYKISMAKDSLVWISLSKFGYEAVRLLAGPDTVMVRITDQKKVMISGYDVLSETSGFTIDFRMLQDLLTGNAVFPGDSIKLSSGTAEGYGLTAEKQGKRFRYLIDPVHFRMVKFEGQEPAMKRSLTVSFSDFHPNPEKLLPFKTSVLAQQPQELRVDLEHSKVETPDSPPDFPFSIPPAYETEYVKAGQK